MNKKNSFSLLATNKTQITAIFFILAVLLLPTSNTHAGVLGVTWNNCWYPQNSYKRPSPKLATCYEGLDLYAQNFGPGQNFSLFSNVMYSNDYVNNHTNSLEFNNAYLQWEDSAQIATIRLGRQFTTQGSLPLYLDGLSAHATLFKYVDISATGGMRLPLRSSYKVIPSSPDSIQPVASFEAGTYLPTGTTAKLEYYGESNAKKIVTNFSGISASQDFHNGSMANAEFLYDITHGRIDRAGIYSTLYLFHSLILDPEISASNRWSDTLLATDVLLNKANLRAGMFAHWMISRSFELGAGYWLHDFYSLGLSHETQVLGVAGPLTLNVKSVSGYGGNATSAGGSLYALKKSNVTIQLHGEAASITYSGVVQRTELIWMGALATQFFPANFFNTRLELQTLGNPYEKTDIRVLLQTTFAFSRFFK
jgi:hypothetical protein